MTMRNLNDPDTHDTTAQRIDFGGPYHIVIRHHGKTIFDEKMGKSDELNIYFAPLGEPADE